MPRYVDEYMTAIVRTESFGFWAPAKFFVRKDCVDPNEIFPIAQRYIEQHPPRDQLGRAAATHAELIPLLMSETEIPFQLTIGWIEHRGEAIFPHGLETIERYLTERLSAWQTSGVQFHTWLTSPACEIFDASFALKSNSAINKDKLVRKFIYQSVNGPPGDPVYHPILVGHDFFRQSDAPFAVADPPWGEMGY